MSSTEIPESNSNIIIIEQDGRKFGIPIHKSGPGSDTVTTEVYWDEVLEKPSHFPPSAHTHGWSTIEEKPAVFPPAAHNQGWDTITGKPSTFTPSAHTHTVSEVIGIGDYATRNWVTEYISGLNLNVTLDWNSIQNKPSAFTPAAHNQAWSTITGAPSSFPPSGTAGGDLTGSYPNPVLASVATAGTAGETANKTLAFSGTFIVPQITIDAKGRATAVNARTMTLPAAPASVSGNAGTATKLATARTITISTGATASAVSFDGSANITLSVSALAASYLTGTIPAAVTASSGTDYTASRVRNIYAGTAAMTAGSTSLTNGTIYLQYE